MRAFFWMWATVALLGAPAEAAGQYPGEIQGVVVDEATGSPVVGADVRVVPAVSSVRLAGGTFRVRGLEPGRYVLHVEALGYAPASAEVDVRNGAVSSVRIELAPAALPLEGLTASVDGIRAARGNILTAEEIRARGSVSAGDLLATLPGVVVRGEGRGGPQVASIRGSGGDAVLVLVDGVPLNDPLTGEADLSTLPASSIRSVAVLPGGGSARYGARAQGGVVLIRTGRDEGPGSVSFGSGSLRETVLDLEGTKRVGTGRLDFGILARRVGGAFDFELPAEAGGGEGRRENTDVRVLSGRAGFSAGGPGGKVTVSVSGEGMRRGLPGRSFAPSRFARQDLGRGRLSASAERGWGMGRRVGGDAYLVFQDVGYRDPAPPFGAAYDDRTRMVGGGADLSMVLAWGRATLAPGVSVQELRVHSSVLRADRGRIARTDGGARLSVASPLGSGWAAEATARVDRADNTPARWYASHDVLLSWRSGGLGVRAGHRSSFSPPTLGDQFFRAGVGVEPNPDLRAERVPSEWHAGVSAESVGAGRAASVEVEAYRADVEGMILWLPDFRFVWSPRNHDVRRWGLDAVARLALPELALDARANGSWNHTTYVRPGLPDVQVVYRPRLSGGASLSWKTAGWGASVNTVFTGARFPVPNAVNELAPFWSTGAALSYARHLGGVRVDVRLEVERLLNETGTLIFAYPDPGRTVRMTVRLGRQPS